MNPNIGKLDRILRILLGLALLGVGIVYQSEWGAIGFLPLFTGLFGYCPAYRLFHFTTCKAQPK